MALLHHCAIVIQCQDDKCYIITVLWGNHTEVLIALIVFIALIALVVPLVPCYPVVIINLVHYLGPPGSSTSQILGAFSRFSEAFLAEREGGSLGNPPGP